MSDRSNGSIDLRKTHPGLFHMSLVLAVTCVLLGFNFIFLTPTFPVYGVAYAVWAGVFLALGATKAYFLMIHHDLRFLRVTMALMFALFVFFGIGTMQPWVEGEGSLQLPILYLAMAALEFPLLIEPPWTARDE